MTKQAWRAVWPVLVLAACSAPATDERAAAGPGGAASRDGPGGTLTGGGVRETAPIAMRGRVTDAANILDPARAAALTARLEALERSGGVQLVVVTVPSLGGRDIADFARSLGNGWQVGGAGRNDGVLLLVAPNERLVRIAVAPGALARLPDAVTGRIVAETILPRFGAGDLPGGIEAGVEAIAARLASPAAWRSSPSVASSGAAA